MDNATIAAECSAQEMESVDTNSVQESTVQDAPVDNTQKVQSIIEGLKFGKDRVEFMQLFDEGLLAGYDSPMSAELALCKLIAAKSQEVDVINAVFKESALYRIKVWDRNGYGEAIIQKVLQSSMNRKRPPKFIITVKTKNVVYEKVSPQLLADWMRSHIDFHIAMDEVNQNFMIFLYENGVYNELNERLFKGLISQQIRDYDFMLVNTRDVNEVYQLLLNSTKYIPLSEFDKDRDIINFKNGILHLNTMQLTPHSPKYLSTIQLPCEWTGKESPTPVFDAFLQRLTSDDTEVQQLLMEYMGLCLSNIPGDTLKKALFLYGPGDTGKSKLISLTQHLLGSKNFFPIDMKGIESRFGSSYIYGKRLIGAADMGFMSVGEMRIFKQLTGGDNIMAERKGQQAFCFKYDGFIWFATNEMPRFASDRKTHTYERFIIIPCNNVIPKEERDPNLESKMYEERDGIVYKVVMALKQFIARGNKLKEPQVVLDAREHYKTTNCTAIEFFDSCMVLSNYKAGNNLTINAIHKAYVSWCKGNNNNHALSCKEFKQELADYLGLDVDEMTVRVSKGIVFKEYTLTHDADSLYGW